MLSFSHGPARGRFWTVLRKNQYPDELAVAKRIYEDDEIELYYCRIDININLLRCLAQFGGEVIFSPQKLKKQYPHIVKQIQHTHNGVLCVHCGLLQPRWSFQYAGLGRFVKVCPFCRSVLLFSPFFTFIQVYVEVRISFKIVLTLFCEQIHIPTFHLVLAR